MKRKNERNEMKYINDDENTRERERDEMIKWQR